MQCCNLPENECTNDDECDQNEECAKLPDGNKCECEPGFGYDAESDKCISSLPVNECEELTDACPEPSTCHDLDVGFWCECPAGKQMGKEPETDKDICESCFNNLDEKSLAVDATHAEPDFNGKLWLSHFFVGDDDTPSFDVTDEDDDVFLTGTVNEDAGGETGSAITVEGVELEIKQFVVSYSTEEVCKDGKTEIRVHWICVADLADDIIFSLAWDGIEPLIIGPTEHEETYKDDCIIEFQGFMQCCNLPENECTNDDDCDNNEECAKLPTGNICQCEPGFEHDANADACLDIDECAGESPVCGPDSTCANNPGSFECICVAKGLLAEGDTFLDDLDDIEIEYQPALSSKKIAGSLKGKLQLSDADFTLEIGTYSQELSSAEDGILSYPGDQTCNPQTGAFYSSEIHFTCGNEFKFTSLTTSDDGCLTTLTASIECCDHDECDVGIADDPPCGENEVCQNTYPGFDCICADGYVLGDNGCEEAPLCNDENWVDANGMSCSQYPDEYAACLAVSPTESMINAMKSAAKDDGVTGFSCPECGCEE